MTFRDAIRRVSDPFSYRLLLSVMRGETPSLLDLDDRPAALTTWGDRRAGARCCRSWRTSPR